MVIFDILINEILSLFIDPSILNTPIGIADWSLAYIDIFKLFFVIAISYFIIWFFVLLPIAILKKIIGYKKIKGGK